MKKKFVTILLASALAMSTMACGDSGSPSATKKEETTKEEITNEAITEEAVKAEDTTPEKVAPKETKVANISLDCAEGTLTFKRAEKTTDYEGNPALLTYFDYTNKKAETSYSQMTFYAQVFQNGVECEMGIPSEYENESYNNATKEIQTGTTLEVAYMFKLSDDTSPTTLKVTDQSAENILNNVYQEQDIVLQ